MKKITIYFKSDLDYQEMVDGLKSDHAEYMKDKNVLKEGLAPVYVLSENDDCFDVCVEDTGLFYDEGNVVEENQLNQV